MAVSISAARPIVLDHLAVLADVVPGIHVAAHLLEEVEAVIDGVGDEHVREPEVLLGLRVVGALDGEVDRLAVLLLALLVDLAVVDHVLFVGRPGPKEHEEIVALLRRDLCRGGGVDGRDADVVDDHLGIVLLAPLLDVLAVEPLVVVGDEVVPLEDPQRLLGRESLLRHGQRGRANACNLDELAPGKGHRRPLLYTGG